MAMNQNDTPLHRPAIQRAPNGVWRMVQRAPATAPEPPEPVSSDPLDQVRRAIATRGK
jgi:hypothetical protein